MMLMRYNFQVRIVSAHRTPEFMYSYALSARERGIQVIIAGAGGAAHLPGKSHKLCFKQIRLVHYTFSGVN